MKTGDLIIAFVRSIVALGFACVVFVLVFYSWPPVAEWALGVGGMTALQATNHVVMLTLGLAMGAVVILLTRHSRNQR